MRQPNPSNPSNRVLDGPACHSCGLPNYQGVCPRCRGDIEATRIELGAWALPPQGECE